MVTVQALQYTVLDQSASLNLECLVLPSSWKFFFLMDCGPLVLQLRVSYTNDVINLTDHLQVKIVSFSDMIIFGMACSIAKGYLSHDELENIIFFHKGENSC